MAISGTPNSVCGISFLETIAASATTAATLQNPINLGNNSTFNWTIGTGGATNINKVVSGLLALVASTPQTIDLSNYTGPGGTITLAKVRGIHIDHQGAVDSSGTVTVKPALSNGFVGPFVTAGLLLSPNSSYHQECRNTAGWTVDGTHKSVTFDPGSNNQTIAFCFWGE